MEYLRLFAPPVNDIINDTVCPSWMVSKKNKNPTSYFLPFDSFYSISLYILLVKKCFMNETHKNMLSYPLKK